MKDTIPSQINVVSYDGVAKTLHWLTVLLIFTAIPLAVIANDIPTANAEGVPDAAAIARVALLFSLHKTIGVSLFFTAVVRIVWAFLQTKPAPLHGDRKMETLAAETVHWLLYGSLVIVLLSGWIYHAAASGFAPIWWPFGQSLPFVPKDQGVAEFFKALHGVFTKVLIASILLHVAGTAKHVVIDRDDTLRRMLPFGKVTTHGTGGHGSAIMPVVTALVVWIAALGVGAALGAFAPKATAVDSVQMAQAAPLAEVESDWQVNDGALTLSIVQFGTALTGQFDDWSADITFEADQNAAEGAKLGEVRVVIATPSLTLGLVTEQASGADFFDTETHPTAVFEADIVAANNDGFIAQGTLDIKGNSVVIALPFNLDITGDTAQMSGQITLDRRDFAIGNALPDEGTLGFAVIIDVALSARKTAAGN